MAWRMSTLTFWDSPLRNFQIFAAANPVAATLACAAAATRNDDGNCGSSPVSVTASSAAASPKAEVQMSLRISRGLCIAVTSPYGSKLPHHGRSCNDGHRSPYRWRGAFGDSRDGRCVRHVHLRRGGAQARAGGDMEQRVVRALLLCGDQLYRELGLYRLCGRRLMGGRVSDDHVPAPAARRAARGGCAGVASRAQAKPINKPAGGFS